MHIPHNRLTFDETEASAVQDVIRSGFWAGGPKLEAMECNLQSTFKVKHAVGVSSGLSALRLVLMGLNITDGDEVIIPAYSCVALPNSVLSLGATPVPVDIDPDTLNLCPQSTEERITPKTKAIIAVNTFGVPYNQEAFTKFNIPVIEDCSHGFSVENINTIRKSPSFAMIISFYATKLISGGEGGAILTDDFNLAESCRNERDYTDKNPNGLRLNEKLTDLQAALICVQLEKLQTFLDARYEMSVHYCNMLKDVNGIQAPLSETNRVWYRYALKVEGEKDLDKIIYEMDKGGVSVRRPIENWMGQKLADFPASLLSIRQVLSLPLYPTLSKTEQIKVCHNFGSCCN